jgi:two-component system, OmpR family, sensor histidine kinase KdpD
MGVTADLRGEPDALLAEAEREGRGRLKVYLGMAPGVGKTYAMLEGARRLKAQGLDVVAGVVETHGRSDTAAMTEGLDTLPRRRFAYRGQTLEEFDIDAALARKPALLLVDELAHTNAAESRHPKRWQDVEELIRAGIDVHTTLNVQHLESLSDVVARITGVRVAETVPDRVLEQADEIELIDLTPEELLARLAEGKVYAPHLAGRARESFFKPGNLTALRELALRMAAQTVDGQLVGYMRAHAIDGPWPAGERIMALVGPDGLGQAVVRAANRIADQMRAPFLAVTVERQGQLPTQDVGDGISEALTLAERLGGRIERLTGNDLVGDVLAFARKANITQIFVGRTRSRWWREVLRRSFIAELIRRADGVAIHVVSERAEKPGARKAASRFALPGFGAYAAGLAGVAAVAVLASTVTDLATSANVAMLFLAAVVFSAVRDGLGPSIATAVVSFVAYNFFFTEPRLTLWVRHWHDLIALAVFLIVAVTTGALAGRVRNQAVAERSRMTALSALYDFSRRLAAKTSVDELQHALVLQVHRIAGAPAVFLLPKDDDLAIAYGWPPEDVLAPRDMAAARWALAHGEAAGAGTGTMPASAWHFRAVRAGARTLGVLGLQTREAPQGDRLQTIDAVLDQGAVALERIRFAEGAARADALAQAETLRSALLSSISHDLRTPLTTILGAASSLKQDLARLRPGDRDGLLTAIELEARRLDRFVNNLLDMTRLEAGVIAPKREWVDLADAVDTAVQSLRRSGSNVPVTRDLPAGLPPVSADAVLLDTVLVNLAENAAKHGAAMIRIGARAAGDRVTLAIEDDGTGIPPDALPHIFDKFYRHKAGTDPVAGAGLGLSICRGLVEAMGGTIRAESPIAAGRGTRIAVVFPAGRPPGQAGEQAA